MKRFFKSVYFGFLISITIYVIAYLIGVFAVFDFTWIKAINEIDLKFIRGIFVGFLVIISFMYYYKN